MLVELEVGLPIGVADGAPRRSGVIGIPPGALLCLYTDGLVERRDQPLDAGMGRLAVAVGEMTGGGGDGVTAASRSLAEAACASVMRALVGHAPASDDVAVLMLHRRPRGH